jgi:hypothetical protein
LKKGYQTIDSIATKDLLNMKQNIFSVRTYLVNGLQENNNFLLVNPLGNEVVQENPFRPETRNYPIDFSIPFGSEYHSTVHIPRGYSIKGIPADTLYNEGDLSLSYHVSVEEDQILIHASFKISYSYFPASYYNQIKNFFKLISWKFNEPIIFSRNVTNIQ